MALTKDPTCDCTHPLSKHRYGAEEEEQDQLVLCDEPGCWCPGFQEAR